jgi:hypothetical protein
MQCGRKWLAAVTVMLCALGVGGAGAEGSGLTPIDARHVALLKGDRIVIYEIDPARGFQLKVVNTVILDAEGQVLGQYRPAEPPAVPSPRPAAPAPASPAPAPPARLAPTRPKPPTTPRLEARRSAPRATLARS